MKSVIRKYLNNLLAKYEGYSYQAIEEIDWINLDPIEIDGKKYFPSVWAQKMTDERMLFVVQVTRWIFLRFYGQTDCIGFLISKESDLEYVDEVYLMNEIGHP